ncbi:MAG: helix-turn-helix transcriptional regulator [Phycisphaerae bacterium]
MSKPPDNAEFLTVKDLQAMFKLSRNKISTMTKTGELPQPYYFGKAVRYAKADIDAFIASRKPKPLRLPTKPL